MTSAVREVADAIKAYLAAHPDGADEAQGIHQWWLCPTVSHSLDLTLRGLDLLELEQIVECRRLGQRIIWRARRD